MVGFIMFFGIIILAALFRTGQVAPGIEILVVAFIIIVLFIYGRYQKKRHILPWDATPFYMDIIRPLTAI